MRIPVIDKPATLGVRPHVTTGSDDGDCEVSHRPSGAGGRRRGGAKATGARLSGGGEGSGGPGGWTGPASASWSPGCLSRRGEAHSAGQRREPREPREDAPGEREMMWETRPVTGSPGRVVPHEEQVHV